MRKKPKLEPAYQYEAARLQQFLTGKNSGLYIVGIAHEGTSVVRKVVVN